jgi:lysophospholipase L1-like esterase
MNKGASGEFGIDGAVRVQNDVPTLIQNGVDVVVLMWGTNDVYSPIYEEMGPTWWRDELVTRLDQAVDVLQAAGISVVLAFPPPNVDPSDAGVLANVRLQDLLPILSSQMSQRGVPFVDLFDAVLAAPDPSPFFESDGVHLTEWGNAFVATRIAPAVQPSYDAWNAQAQP